MCISNNAGTQKTSSMELDDKIPANCKKQDQGHRLPSEEISHKNRSSSLKYMLSFCSSKITYKQTSVCNPNPKLYPSSSAWYSWKSIHWEKVFLFYNNLWRVFANEISYKRISEPLLMKAVTLKNLSGDWRDRNSKSEPILILVVTSLLKYCEWVCFSY